VLARALERLGHALKLRSLGTGDPGISQHAHDSQERALSLHTGHVEELPFVSVHGKDATPGREAPLKRDRG